MDTIIAGNTAYWTEALLKDTFGNDNLVICGADLKDKKIGRIKWFKVEPYEDRFKDLFSTYSFERAIYFSDYVTYQGIRGNEFEELRAFLRLCLNSEVKQFVYVGSDFVLDQVTRGKDIIFNAVEELIEYYDGKSQIDMKIIHIPYLVSGKVKDDYWFKVFDNLEVYSSYTFPCTEDSKGHFIEMSDLGTFLYRLFDKWDNEDFTITLKANANATYANATKLIKEKYPKAKVSYVQSDEKITHIEGDDIARKKYGWFAKIDVMENLEEHYKEYKSLGYHKPTLKEILKEKFKLKSKTMMILELIIGALIIELLVHMSSNTIQFRMIDFRLLFVVLIATVYGTGMGVVAALIECVSLAYSYYENGTNAILLFYDPGNWLPFILLLLAGAVCGYTKQKKDEEANFIKKQNESLIDQVDFITQLYEEAMDYKNQYKKDLIGSRDGFGRIFDVVKKLSTTVPEQIFAESIPVMEDVLDNQTIAIYTINDPNARFARLEVCSQRINNHLKKSMNLEGYEDILNVIKSGEVWFNSGLDEGFPSYIAGIVNKGNVSVLIMIYNAKFNQVGTYYVNLIKILSGLIENFIVKAWEYETAIAEKIYIEDTNIVNDEYFLEQLDIIHDMAENQRASFRLFKFDHDGRSLKELDEILRTKVRNNDLIGLGKDNNLYLLASQVDAESEQIILNRFKKIGLGISVVDSVGG